MTTVIEPIAEPTVRHDIGVGLMAALDGPYHDLRQAGRAALTADDLVRDPGQTLDEARQWTLNALRSLAARGIGNAGYPVNGDPVDPARAVVSFETVAHGDLSLTIKAGVQFGLFGGAVAALGTDAQIATWLPRIVSGELLGCFAMTEIGHGSDVQGLETRLVYDEATDEIVVDSPTPSSTKTYIGNAAVDGRMAAVFGQLLVEGERRGVHCALVPIRTADGATAEGVTTGDNGPKGGLAGVDNGTLRFDHVRVPRAQLLSRFGTIDDDGHYVSSIANENRRFFTMLGTLVRGRVCVGASASLAARRSLSIAGRYALRRRQFDAPGHPDGVLLLDYRTHQLRLLPLIARAYAYGFAHNELVALLTECQTGEVSDARQRELEATAAGLKAAQTRFANQACQEAREACGGAGYIAENGLTLTRADVDVFATFEGDNTVLEQLVAKSLLLRYADAWAGLDTRGQMTRTADLLGRFVLERTGTRGALDRIATTAQRRSTESSVLDRAWHVAMFEERERHILEGLAARVRNANKRPAAERFDALNRAQDHFISAARAHTERLTLGAFVNGVDATTDPDVRRILSKLCDLYVMSSLSADRGWFQEHHRMSSARAKVVASGVAALCEELRPDAEAIIEGLGIPEGWLGSAMLT